MLKELLNKLNKLYRDDELIKEIAQGFSSVLIDLLNDLFEVENNYWFDTLDEELGIPMMSELLGIILKKELTTDEKRKLIESRWKNDGNLTEKLFKKISNHWNGGEIEVSLKDSIEIKFTSVAGIPTAIDKLKEEFNLAKPAFLLLNYFFMYLSWDMLETWNLSWDDIESKNLDFDKWETTIEKP